MGAWGGIAGIAYLTLWRPSKNLLTSLIKYSGLKPSYAMAFARTMHARWEWDVRSPASRRAAAPAIHVSSWHTFPFAAVQRFGLLSGALLSRSQDRRQANS